MMSDDEKEIMGPALYVDSVADDFDLDIPPTSGAEYLRRVQKEAESCPEIVVAKFDRTAYRENQTVKVQGPQRDDVQKWCQLCFGKLRPVAMRHVKPAPRDDSTDRSMRDESVDRTMSDASLSSDAEEEGSPPLMSILVQMNQHTVQKVLEYHINWFEVTGFTPEQGQWLYALLVCLEKPLTPETCSSLRSLARNCANLRATIDSQQDPLLVHLNLLICLVARYFDQMDLADGS